MNGTFRPSLTRFLLAIGALLALSSSALAQALNAPAFALNQNLPNVIVQSVQYKPPFSMTPKKTTLPKAIGAGPAVLVYVIPGNAPAEAAALETLKASKSWKNVKLALVLRGMTDAEIQSGLKWIEANEIAVPVVIDNTMEVALGLQALQVPSYAMIDADGKLKLRKFEGLDKRANSGETVLEIIAAAETGKEIPISDGAMREDTRTLIGQKAARLSLEAAPYSKVQSKVEIGPGVRAKPTLVVFWMATCPHCQREMPRIHQWWSKHKADVELVTITRTEAEQLRTYTTGYLAKQNIGDIPVYSAIPEVYNAFKVEGIPTWAMLHPDGTIVAAHVGEDARLSQSLDAALAAAGKK